MKCIDKPYRTYNLALLKTGGIAVVSMLFLLFVGCGNAGQGLSSLNSVESFEVENFNHSLYSSALFASSLCVAGGDVAMGDFSLSVDTMTAGLFDITHGNVMYAHHLHERIFPASTTKIMTAYIALQEGDMDAMVTFSETAFDLMAGAAVSGIQVGEQIRLGDLVVAMLLQSGNDGSIAIAEHIAGSEEAFVQLMNERARQMGASNTRFMNSHGLHDDDQYTTIYDLYLIFNTAIQDSRFVDILSLSSFNAEVTMTNGETRTVEWLPTNSYHRGWREVPEGVEVIGGKTGTTDQAGTGFVLLNRDAVGNEFISIIMGAPNTDARYENMNRMWSEGILHETDGTEEPSESEEERQESDEVG